MQSIGGWSSIFSALPHIAVIASIKSVVDDDHALHSAQPRIHKIIFAMFEANRLWNQKPARW